jgi:outer membrane protein, heavy metal efflux system
MKSIKWWLIITIILSSIFGQELNLSTLTELIVQNNITLKLSKKEVDVKLAELEQSKAYENPSIEFETGLGNETEVSGMLTQSITMGGKRKHNIRLHELELSIAQLEYENLKNQVFTDASVIFVEILHLQACKTLQEKRIEISEELLFTVEKKVVAGKLSTAEKSRAKIQLFQEKSSLRKIDRSLDVYWNNLFVFFGDSKQLYTIAIGELTKISTDLLNVTIENSYDYQQAKLQIEIQNINIELEKSNRIPDIELGAGIKQVDSSENTFQFGVSIPLPIFNRNKGNIKRSIIEYDKSQFLLAELSINLQTDIFNIKTILDDLKFEINTLTNEIIPEANSAYSIIKDGYINGRFTYLDVVDAKEMWFQSQKQYLDALTEYHNQRLRLNGISGNANHNLLGEN